MYQAELYSKNNNLVLEAGKFALKLHGNLLNFSKIKSVIDIGMGDGNMAEFIIKNLLLKNFEYVGTDISKEMIEFAQKRNFFQDKELELLDIETVDLPQKFFERFDLVMSFNVFHWLKNIEQALQNVYSMLKPGGMIFIAITDGLPADRAFETLSKNPKWAKYETHRLCSKFYKTNIDLLEYYQELLKKIGFNQVNCFRDNNFTTKQDATTFKNCAVTYNAIIRKVCETEKEDYIRDYLKLLLELNFITTSSNGEYITMSYPIITVVATK